MSRSIAGNVGVASFVGLLLVACSGDSGSPLLPGSGGISGVGGNSAPGNGGAQNGTGGALGSGGQNQNQGGAVGPGGAVGQGGAVTNAGGQVAVGGSATGGKAIGGAATGGAVSAGGAATGGKATGGATNLGGNAMGGNATGGATNVGGNATGGKATTGGAVNAGGAATGGKATTGGAVGAGGAATGGKATGGATATGGSGGGGTTPITVYMAGDSTMQPCSSACPCGYGSQFQQYFNSNATVVNRARGGRSIQTWLYEGAVSSSIGGDGECTLTSTAYDTGWTTMLNAMKTGDWLLIGFGINDGDSACPRHVGTARFQTLLGVMATAAKAKGASVIFLTSTSAIACSGSTAQTNRGFGPQTIAAGTANNVPVIDLTKISAALYTSLGLCPNSSDYTSTTSAVGKFFCADHTHFEAAGASQVAGAVAKAIKDQGIGLAAYLL